MSKIKTYDVFVRAKKPAWNDNGMTVEVFARNAREACKRARDYVKREMLYDRFDGALNVKATQRKEQ